MKSKQITLLFVSVFSELIKKPIVLQVIITYEKKQDLNNFFKIAKNKYQNMISLSPCEIKWLYGFMDYNACRHSHFIHSNMTIICDDGFDVKWMIA